MTNVLNTLFVTTPKAYVAVEGETLKVRVGGETRVQIPSHHLSALVCIGLVSVSPEAMAACAERGVAIVFLSMSGRYLARVEGRTGATPTLRRAQYAIAERPERSAALARSFVCGKIANSRAQLLRAGRTRRSTESIDRAAERLATLANRASEIEDIDRLRGIEGEAAARYFEVFDAMLEREDGETAAFPLRFERRSRRPPENELNAMLSFGYSLLSADCIAAVQAAGLDPGVGYLHAERPGRPALALDLMEELRALWVDRRVLALVRLGQIAASGFERLPTGEVRMNDATRRTFITAYQEAKQTEVTHPLTGQKMPWALVPSVQARLLARAIRGESEYVPFMLGR
jgi:CRISPR-associated protein Cas1